MEKNKAENKAKKTGKADQSKCGHKYFNMIDGELYCSECGLPAAEAKQKIETK